MPQDLFKDNMPDFVEPRGLRIFGGGSFTLDSNLLHNRKII